MRSAALMGILSLLCSAVCAQPPLEDAPTCGTAGRDGFIVLPALAYMPETRFNGGVVGAYIWKSQDTLRKSSVSGQPPFSQNEQVQTGFSFEVFSDSGRSTSSGGTIYA